MAATPPRRRRGASRVATAAGTSARATRRNASSSRLQTRPRRVLLTGAATPGLVAKTTKRRAPSTCLRRDLRGIVSPDSRSFAEIVQEHAPAPRVQKMRLDVWVPRRRKPYFSFELNGTRLAPVRRAARVLFWYNDVVMFRIRRRRAGGGATTAARATSGERSRAAPCGHGAAATRSRTATSPRSARVSRPPGVRPGSRLEYVFDQEWTARSASNARRRFDRRRSPTFRREVRGEGNAAPPPKPARRDRAPPAGRNGDGSISTTSPSPIPASAARSSAGACSRRRRGRAGTRARPSSCAATRTAASRLAYSTWASRSRASATRAGYF